MQLYFAPMEGITTYTYRNTHAKFFGGCDMYYAPFIVPSDKERVSRKCLRDILPEHNRDIPLRVQVLTTQADSFLKFEEKIKELGYKEVNINLGCPAARVVQKGRGSGALKDTVHLEKFLLETFDKTGLKTEIKTRIGFADKSEADALLDIYNQLDMPRLIVHPRTKTDYYGGVPHDDVFAMYKAHSKNPLCYNGNVFSVADYQRIVKEFDGIESVMLGRGAVANPALFRQIRGGDKLTTEELIAFSELLAENYYAVLQSEVFTLQKLKEIWVYILWNFPEETKAAKAIKKAGNLSEFRSAIRMLPVL